MSVPTPVYVRPSTADASFWTRFHELRRVRHAELHPDDPFRPDNLEEAIIKRPDPFQTRDYCEVASEGAIVSLYYGQTVSPRHPGHSSNKHLYWAEAYVRPEHRRKGMAVRWLRVAAERMDAHGCTVLGIGTNHDEADNMLEGISADDQSARAFLNWLGAQPKLVNVRSQLVLAKVEWRLVEDWLMEGRRRSPETRLEYYDGPLPEWQWADFAAQRSTLLNTLPLEDLDLGEIVITPEQMREAYKRSAVVGLVEHTVVAREPDGTISAITDVKWAPYAPRQINQVFTGVLPRARGRGVGKWIKAAMLLRLRATYPGAELVITDNAESNVPMLRINRALGFERSRTSIEYQLSRQQLGAKLE